MELTKRGLIIGASCLIAAPAIVKIENIMRIHDPLVHGVSFQSWPFDDNDNLIYFSTDVLARLARDDHGNLVAEPSPLWRLPLKCHLPARQIELTHGKDRLSTFLPYVHEYNAHWENVYWKEIW